MKSIEKWINQILPITEKGMFLSAGVIAIGLLLVIITGIFGYLINTNGLRSGLTDLLFDAVAWLYGIYAVTMIGKSVNELAGLKNNPISQFLSKFLEFSIPK